MATYSKDILPLPPFASLPSALLVSSMHEPGAHWGSIQAGAAISLAVSRMDPDVSRSHPNGA